MPRYRFSWENLPPHVLNAVCSALGLKTDNPSESLRAAYGARPKTEFVRDAWSVLRDHWLAEDAASRAVVIQELRSARLGAADAPVGTQEEQMDYLRSCHNQLSLREIALSQFLAVGEPSSKPGSPQEPHPSSPQTRRHPRQPLRIPTLHTGQRRRSLGERTRTPTPPLTWRPLLLDDVFTAMSIDAQWSQREARGFEWWACRLRQRVWADPVRQSRGDVITRFHAETDYIKDVPDQNQTYEVLAAVNGLADLSTFYFDPAEGVIRSHAAMYFHPEIRWMEQLLKTAVALQDADAHASAQQLAKILGGVPAISQHPTSGERPDLDDMLNIAASMQIDAQPSPFTAEVFEWVVAKLGPPAVRATGGVAGLEAEWPFFEAVPARRACSVERGHERGRHDRSLDSFGYRAKPSCRRWAALASRPPGPCRCKCCQPPGQRPQSC